MFKKIVSVDKSSKKESQNDGRDFSGTPILTNTIINDAGIICDGVAISSSIVSLGSSFAKFTLPEKYLQNRLRELSDQEIDAEIKRFESAKRYASEKKAQFFSNDKVVSSGLDVTFIDMLLKDTFLWGSEEDIRGELKAGKSLEMIVYEKVMIQYEAFDKMINPFMKAKSEDVGAIGKAIIGYLLRGDNSISSGEKVILVGEVLDWSDLMLVNNDNLGAMISIGNAPTGHAAIVARALEIPFVKVSPAQMQLVRAARNLGIDARSHSEATLYLNLDNDDRDDFLRKIDDWRDKKVMELDICRLPNRDRYGRSFGMRVNVDIVDSVRAAVLQLQQVQEIVSEGYETFFMNTDPESDKYQENARYLWFKPNAVDLILSSELNEKAKNTLIDLFNENQSKLFAIFKDSGLIRGEFLFDGSSTTENDMIEVYTFLVEVLDKVVARLFNPQGDKMPDYFSGKDTSLKGCLNNNKNLYLNQMVAMVVANVDVVLAPMVSDEEDIAAFKASFQLAVAKAIEERAKGNYATTGAKNQPQISAMIETAGSIVNLDRITAEFDAVSVGSNDLEQYVFGELRYKGAVSRQKLERILRDVKIEFSDIEQFLVNYDKEFVVFRSLSENEFEEFRNRMQRLGDGNIANLLNLYHNSMKLEESNQVHSGSNKEGKHRFKSYNPLKILLLEQITMSAKANMAEIGLCGNIANHRNWAYLLTGMGIDYISISPNTSVAARIKSRLTSSSLGDYEKHRKKIFSNPEVVALLKHVGLDVNVIKKNERENTSDQVKIMMEFLDKYRNSMSEEESKIYDELVRKASLAVHSYLTQSLSD